MPYYSTYTGVQVDAAVAATLDHETRITTLETEDSDFELRIGVLEALGFYTAGANDVRLKFGATDAVKFTNTYSEFLSGPARLAAGAVGAPSLTFTGETNTGFYKAASNDVRLSIGGTDRLKVSSAAISGTVPYLGSDGSVSNPSLAFSTEASSGWFLDAAGDVRLSVAGTLRLKVTSSALTVSSSQLLAPDGAAGAPGFSFSGGGSSGLYRAGAGDIRMSISGTDLVQWTAASVAPLATGAISFGSSSFRFKQGFFGGNTATASAPPLDLSQTWNNAAVAFEGLVVSVTNTASSTASTLLKAVTDGNVTFQIGRRGEVTFNGSLAQFTGTYFADDSSGVDMVGRKARGTQTSPSSINANDIMARMIAIGYGTSFGAGVGAVSIKAAEAYSGTAKGSYITFEATPIGSTTRAEYMRLASTGLLCLGGGETSSFPALKRNSTTLEVKLADDSAYGPLRCAAFRSDDFTMNLAKKLIITSGTGQRSGNATLVAGTVTVNNTTVTANTVVILTRKTAGGTVGNMTYTLSAGNSFTINSDNILDTSTVSYLLLEVV